MVKKRISSIFDKAKDKLNKFKKTSEQKRAETKAHITRLAEMQRYIDNSPEKRGKFMWVLKNVVDEETSKRILEKGVVVYVKLLDILKVLEEDLTKEGIDYKSIQGKCTAKNRAKTNDWFCDNPENKVIFITDAGGQSLNLHATNELILYNLPDGDGKFKQVIGRIARGFGKYTKYNIHQIIVEESLDEYKQVLLSSKKELEMELLSADTIPLKESGKFNLNLLKKVRDRLLWKNK